MGVHALKGEVRVLPDNPESSTLAPGIEVVLRRGGESVSHKVASVRRHQRLLLVRLAGVEDRTSAEQYRGYELFVAVDSLQPAGPNEFYYHELEGMEVCTLEGEHIGVVRAILPTPGADLLVVRGPEREVLVPLIAAFIKSVDRQRRRVCIQPIPGLLDQ
ncbi:MAG: ribosome maturation factor RimM [Candidatus Binatia bacterium]|nr:MAG: ribosome maturation factor RimM [Candidatus Binatia bacterium]